MTAFIDRHPARAFASLSVVYFVVVCALSSTKLLWLDELITLHIARLGSAKAIWSALAAGADPNPPLIHLAVMGCRRLFGEHELALRLPAIAGYWMGMLSLFLFLKRRLPASWALAGTVLSMDMGAFEWSYESRSYAVFYGFAMLAMYCWSRAANARRSTAARYFDLAGVTLALAGGLCTNYFAVLAFFPIAAGELTRTVEAARRAPGRLEARSIVRAVDWPVWAAMAVAATPLLVFRPLIQRSIRQFAPYAWNKVSLGRAIDGYSDMVEMVLYPVLALLVFALAMRWLGTFCRNCRGEIRPRWIGGLATAQARYINGTERLKLHEAAAVFILMAYPFAGYVVASIGGGMLSPRFVIPVCFGFAIAGVLSAYRTFGHIRLAAVAMLVFCVVWWVARESLVGYWYEEQKQSFYKVVDHMPPPEYPGEPIVLSDNLLVLPFEHYAPPAMAARLVLPVDFPAIRLARGEDSAEENLWAGRNWLYRFPIVPLAVFQHSAGRYIILTGDRDWLGGDLLRHYYPVHRLAINTRAGAAGCCNTPLSHGTPVFLRAAGDRYIASAHYHEPTPAPFVASANLPAARLTPEAGGPFDDQQERK